MDLTGIYHHEIPDFIREAAATAPMQRLKGVGMNCGCEYTSFPQFSIWQSYTRFDHSLGASLITWHFTSDPRQALAALFHDVATPVFSHVVDFLRGDYETQESTEDGTREIILGCKDILAVCRKYGIDPEDITDYHRYPIADNDSPRLSADRLEYTLGNIVNFGYGTVETVKAYYKNLQAAETELVFRNEETACAFAKDALRCSRVYVADADRYSMQILSEILAEAIRDGIITPADLYMQETDVVNKLEHSPLLSRWQAFRTLNRVIPAPGGRVILAKKRYIDPCTIEGTRASSLDTAFRAELADFLAHSFDYGLIED
jgi:HD superfamily phosphohydrolase